MDRSIKFAKRVFRYAGIYGVIVIAPQYFLEQRIGIESPPAINHPEYFYGFVGVGLAWQVAFLIMSTDPVRYRPLIPACLIEKFSFGLAVPILWWFHRVSVTLVPFALLDMVLGILFWIAYLKTNPKIHTPNA